MRQTSTAILAWYEVSNQPSLMCSSRNFPLKLSMWPFCMVRPGWMSMWRMPCACAQAINSGRLSVRTAFGYPLDRPKLLQAAKPHATATSSESWAILMLEFKVGVETASGGCAISAAYRSTTSSASRRSKH